MESVFLSYSFRPQDRDSVRDLVDDVDHLLASHGIQSVRGRYLGGDPIWPEVQKRIEASDGLIALLTRRDELANNAGYTTHPYVIQELGRARQAKRRAIALVETGIKDDQLGAEVGFERLFWDRANPLPAFISLSETIGLWKREAGRIVKVQILPEDLALEVGESAGKFLCRYRLTTEGTASAWIDREPITEIGGTFLYVGGVGEKDTIQVEIKNDQRRWFAPAQQWVSVRFKEAQ
jgi:hypothetical protein